MSEGDSRRGMGRLGALILALPIALLATGVPSRVVWAEDEIIQQAHVNAGKVWYERYCTSCHGPGGASGSALYRGSDRRVDLRTYVKRNNGIFPTLEWMAVVEHIDLASPHADVWESIRTAQGGISESGVAGRGIVASIAEYILSVQTK